MALIEKRISLNPSKTYKLSWVTYLRIILGLIILLKGFSFVQDRHAIQDLIYNTNFQLSIWGAVHYVVFTHIVGGIFVLLGFHTKLACLFLLPVLFSAVFFINITSGFSFFNSELWLSIVILLLLIAFMFLGSGDYSLDKLMNKPGRKRDI